MILAVILFTILVCAAVGASIWFQRRQRKAALSDAAVRPALEQALTLYLAGNTDLAQLETLARSHPEETADMIAVFGASISGDTRDHLSGLALSLALVHQWCEDTCAKSAEVRRKAYSRLESVSHYEPVHRISEGVLLRGLRDADPKARHLAARALAHGATPEHAAEVFEVAVEDAENRLVLAQAIRPYAMSLFSTAVSAALSSFRSETVLGALEILESWECALSLEDVSPLTKHPNDAVRIKTMRLLPNVPLTWENRNALVAGLADPNVQVSIAAAQIAARMKANFAIPALELCLQRGDRELEQAAAQALSEMRGGPVPAEPCSPVSQETGI